MIRNSSYNFFRWMEVHPEKMADTHHIMRYAHDSVYRSFFRGIPPSTENFLQLFLKHLQVA